MTHTLDTLCIQDTWFQPPYIFKISGYNLVNCFYPRGIHRGGCSIYIRNNISLFQPRGYMLAYQICFFTIITMCFPEKEANNTPIIITILGRVLT